MKKRPVSLVLSGLIILSNVHSIESVHANEKTTNYNQTTLTNYNDIVHILDKDLRDAIYKELKLSSTENLTVKKLQELKTLKINNTNTSNLEGIQHCKNLEELSIIDCNVSDISVLSALTSLKSLNLDTNYIKDISPLAELNKLEVISLSSNYISNVNPLSNLRNLKVLDLSDNCISDLRPLSNIKDNLGESVEFDYQTIDLDPIEMKNKQVIMQIPKVYDIDGNLLEKPSKFSDTGDYKIVDNTVVWTNIKEGSTLEIIFENEDKTFDITLRQKVIKPQIDISLTDIKGHWAYETINNFINNGYINGYEDKTFKPDNSITRAEFIKIFNRYFSLTNKSGQSLNDTANHWAKDEIDIAITNNIISGFEDKTFRPDEPITREQAALVISNHKKLQNNNFNNLSKYKDSSSVSSWAKDAVEAILEKGYMNGYSDNTLKPKSPLTRAEAVTLLSRVK